MKTEAGFYFSFPRILLHSTSLIWISVQFSVCACDQWIWYSFLLLQVINQFLIFVTLSLLFSPSSFPPPPPRLVPSGSLKYTKEAGDSYCILVNGEKLRVNILVVGAKPPYFKVTSLLVSFSKSFRYCSHRRIRRPCNTAAKTGNWAREHWWRRCCVETHKTIRQAAKRQIPRLAKGVRIRVMK